MPLTVSTKLCWYAHPFVWTNGMLAAISSRYLVGREWPTLKLLLDESPVKFRQIFCRTIVRTISQTCLKGKFARNLYNIYVIIILYISVGFQLKNKVFLQIVQWQSPSHGRQWAYLLKSLFSCAFSPPPETCAGGLALRFRTAHGVAGRHISMRRWSNIDMKLWIRSGVGVEPFRMFSARLCNYQQLRTSKNWSIF
jgi:hypothetical protein